MSKTLYACEGALPAPRGGLVRHTVAVALRSASLALTRLSRRVHAVRTARSLRPVPELEFYAEAGAPEGALYLDGELVGYVPGVSRL